MKIGRILLFIIMAVFYVACKQPVTDDLYHLVCTISEDEHELSLDALIKSRNSIILEQGSESFISDIQNIRFFEGEYYILDGIKQTVLVFGENGDFRRQIATVGKGPGELSMPQDFVIDTIHRSVNILDSQLRRIFRYTLKGSFIDEIALDGSYTSFHAFDQDNYLWERVMSTVVNYFEDGNVLKDPDDNASMAYGKPGDKKYFFPFNAQDILDGTIRYNRNCFSVFRDGVLFWKFFDNTIYYITESQDVYKYNIDFLEKNIPEHVMELPFQKRIEILESSNGGTRYRGIIGNVIGINDMIVFSYMSYAGLIFIAWDIENNRCWRLTDPVINRNDLVLFQISHNIFACIVTDYSDVNEAVVTLHVFQ